MSLYRVPQTAAEALAAFLEKNYGLQLDPGRHQALLREIEEFFQNPERFSVPPAPNGPQYTETPSGNLRQDAAGRVVQGEGIGPQYTAQGNVPYTETQIANGPQFMTTGGPQFTTAGNAEGYVGQQYPSQGIGGELPVAANGPDIGPPEVNGPYTETPLTTEPPRDGPYTETPVANGTQYVETPAELIEAARPADAGLRDAGLRDSVTPNSGLAQGPGAGTALPEPDSTLHEPGLHESDLREPGLHEPGLPNPARKQERSNAARQNRKLS